jgi:hypothetical protein
MKFAWQWLLVVSVAVVGACDAKERGGPIDGGSVFIDAAIPVLPDAAPQYGDADIPIDGDGGTCAPAICQHPVDDGCVLEEACDNGLDDNCNGVIDEDCPCQAGAVQSCFLGPPGRADVGACQRGTQTCEGDSEFGKWGPCTGGIFPTGDVCDGLDNNCNGCADDNPACCDVLTQCPDQNSLPEAHPFTDYTINGANFFGSAVVKWTWTVEGGPCDIVLKPSQSFTLNGTSTSTVSGPTTSQLIFRPTLSGDYTVTVTVKHADGTTESCTFIVHVAAPGLRVELCWEKTGHADIDLHVHKPGSTADWFDTSDDCYYANCKAGNSLLFGPSGGLAHSPLSECSGAPGAGGWQTAGYCGNPRLDIDNISTVGVPENINIDTPQDGQVFRVAAHYYGASASPPAIVHPIVNIYCNGSRVGTYGQVPDQLQNFEGAGGFEGGPIWRVVDVLTHVDATGTTTGCDLTPLHNPMDLSAPYLTCPVPGSPDFCADNSF